MLSFLRHSFDRDRLDALDRSFAVIEFNPHGQILSANENFLTAMGYRAQEVIGRHHRLFLDDKSADSSEYHDFWEALRRGERRFGQFRRLAKGGREVWIEATYTPIKNAQGRTERIIKFATDITSRKMTEIDRGGQLAALDKTLAVIAFDLDGTILEANDNFLRTVGYRLDEIRGRPHSLFAEPAYAASRDYADFWRDLREGKPQAGRFRRLGKGGRPVWIEATYNPILDSEGRPYKVVKFASDVSSQVKLLEDLQTLLGTNFQAIETAVSRSTAEASHASGRAQDTLDVMQTMAAAAEEMAASVLDISQGMAQARRVTDMAWDQSQGAEQFADRLSAAAESMEGIVALIKTIAGQINLLALNATIESARAGEAGRGFAVVAQEVKLLATQAAKATEDISAQIDGIAALSNDVVGSVDSIRSCVRDLRERVVATANAVDQQSAVTHEISANMQGVARSVQSVTGNIDTITQSVRSVSEAVAVARDAAVALTR